MLHHRRLYTFLLFLSLVYAPLAQAGLLSAISKAARKAEVPDSAFSKLPEVNWQQLDAGFADGVKPTVLRSKLNADNEWVLMDDAGLVVDDVASLSNPALVIDKAHLPRSLEALDKLPRGAPVLVRADQRLFRIENRNGWMVKAGHAGMRANSGAELKTALHHFERPWSNGPVRIVGLKDEAANSMSLRRGVDVNTVLNAPDQLRGQTLALSGPIKNNQISVAGKKLSLDALQEAAALNDISLIVLESHGRVSPKALLKQLDIDQVDGVPQNTGDFLSSLQQPGAGATYTLSPAGKNQTLIVRQPERQIESVAVNPGAVNTLAISDALVRVALYRPSEARYEEINSRLVSWLPNGLIVYWVVSLVLGVMIWGTATKVFFKHWPASGTENKLLRAVESSFAALMFLAFLCFFGLPLAIAFCLWKIVQAIWFVVLLIGGLGMKLVGVFR